MFSRSHDDGQTFNRADLLLQDGTSPNQDVPLGLTTLADILVTPGERAWRHMHRPVFVDWLAETKNPAHAGWPGWQLLERRRG